MNLKTDCKAVRIANPCDTCVLRRVKCGVERPCNECRKRGLECTSLRTRKKRGPKGPRQATSDRVRRYQKHLSQSPGDNAGHAPTPPTPNDARGLYFSASDGSPEDRSPSNVSVYTYCGEAEEVLPMNPSNDCRPSHTKHKIPLAAYRRFMRMFHTRLYPIWPVVSTDRLLADMTFNENDTETYALAAALCAATISQLRLEEHTNSTKSISSRMFAQEAERFRSDWDYREDCGLPSLLTAFFLHMYYSNANKLRTAALLLREAITCCHLLELHQSDTFAALGSKEQALRLRVYWLLFISELTFAAQNGLPTIMSPIDAMPRRDDHLEGADLHAFVSLTHLFSYLRHPKKAIEGSQRDSESSELAAIQAKLSSDGDDAALNETQRVDLCVTRQWIRILTWEYMTRHFPMSCHAEDQAFSLLLPMQIGQEILSFFANVDPSFILAHGYGMELKIFRMADSILDIMMCVSAANTADGMLLGAGDVLSSLQRVILMVGGRQSDFFGKLQRRLGTYEVSTLAQHRVLPAERVPPTGRYEAEEPRGSRGSRGSAGLRDFACVDTESLMKGARELQEDENCSDLSR